MRRRDRTAVHWSGDQRDINLGIGLGKYGVDFVEEGLNDRMWVEEWREIVQETRKMDRDI